MDKRKWKMRKKNPFFVTWTRHARPRADAQFGRRARTRQVRTRVSETMRGAQSQPKVGSTLWNMYQEGRWRYRHARAQRASVRIAQLASRTRMRQVRVRAG